MQSGRGKRKENRPRRPCWPEFKERLYFQLACDRNLSGWDYRVGIILIVHLNSETLLTWPSHETMAALLGVPGESGIRQAKRAVERLIARGHFELAHRGGGSGRGQHGDSNHYRPVLKDPSHSPLRVTNQSPLSPRTDHLRVTNQTLKGDKSGSLRVTKCPPEPYKEPEKEPEARGFARSTSPAEGGYARFAAAERRQAEEETKRQVDHEQQLAEDPTYRVQTRWWDFIANSRSSLAEWILWLPGVVEAAGEAEVVRWHANAQERAPDRPLSHLRSSLADWHAARQAPPAEADGPSGRRTQAR